MNYSIGIPKEIKLNENRVSLTPIEVKKLTDLNIKVFIEKNAGLTSFYLNDEYSFHPI
jgi:alanine dehydrogenase